MEHHTIEKSHSRAPLLRTQPAHRRTKNRFSNRMINDGNFRATGRSSWTRCIPAAAVSTCTSNTLLRTIFRVTIHRLFKVGKFSLPRTDFPFSRIRGYQHRLHYATIKARKFAVWGLEEGASTPSVKCQRWSTVWKSVSRANFAIGRWSWIPYGANGVAPVVVFQFPSWKKKQNIFH